MNNLAKYTVLCSGPFQGGALGPDAPAGDNTVQNLTDARAHFLGWVRGSGFGYSADGYGQPSGEVYLTEAWDGISYGDPVGIFELGPRGGATFNRY